MILGYLIVFADDLTLEQIEQLLDNKIPKCAKLSKNHPMEYVHFDKYKQSQKNLKEMVNLAKINLCVEKTKLLEKIILSFC